MIGKPTKMIQVILSPEWGWTANDDDYEDRDQSDEAHGG